MTANREQRGQLVLDHAADMLRVLNLPKNAEKGDWTNVPLWTLFNLLRVELDELKNAIWTFEVSGGDPQDLIDEAADVSNFAAFISDSAKKRSKYNGV